MARTDAHRPSAINPDEYDFVACDYYGPDGAFMAGERMIFRAHMERTGAKYAEHHNSGSCHICGAAALYVAKYHHRPSNTYIVTGEDCAMKMDMGQPGAFKALRATVAHERKTTKGKNRAKEMLALLGLSPAWPIYDYGFTDSWRKEEPIIQSIVYKLVKYGNMSEPQAALIAKLLGQIKDRTRLDAERAAQQAQQAATSQHLGNVGERLDFNLTVKFTTSFETQFGVMHVHSMEDAAGNVVVYKGNKIAAKGEQVQMKATVKKHDEYKGVKQTLVSRPKLVEPANA